MYLPIVIIYLLENINYLITPYRIYGLKPFGILPRFSYGDLKTMLDEEPAPEKEIQKVSKTLHDILELYKKSMRVTRK